MLQKSVPYTEFSLYLDARQHSPRLGAFAVEMGTAALLVTGDDAASLEFVCLDEALAVAGEREGLRVLS